MWEVRVPFVQRKGHTDTCPQALRRMARDGQEMADRTWSHKVLTDLSPKGVAAEPAPVPDDVLRVTGRSPSLMRPPQGRTDDDVSAVMKALGLAQVLWSVTAKDYATTDSALITRRVMSGRAGTASFCRTSATRARFPRYRASSTRCTSRAARS
ncbi:polysaccharide deacetylase family protein [Streptomyces sp. NPDC002133]|uniref:polysaccharide deacetylase family protein n=1 Tax=Streptomyces sp. NPDC002133 TaxID=3154409 RepID=UPI00331CA8E8